MNIICYGPLVGSGGLIKYAIGVFSILSHTDVRVSVLDQLLIKAYFGDIIGA